MLQKLTTVWGENLGETPWNVYPRPQMKRDSYVNLNGWWDFCAVPGQPKFDKKMLVPYPPESALSGVEEHFEEGISLYYRRKFTLPAGFNKGRVLLHIGAADQRADVYVNQNEVGRHKGGYDAFTMDITAQLKEENELLIRCVDDLRDLTYPYGKQTLNRGGMWYTPVSGIWQTVWLESVPETYIENLKIENRGASVKISITPALDGKVILEGKAYPLTEGAVEIIPENLHFWSPEDPYLYQFAVETPEDRVESYFALRTMEVKEIGGVQRLCLNGKPYFFHGLLDQGYWPDGIYTPADPAAYAYDVQKMKDLGFNMLRKHIKVEPEEFYYQCDRLGMVVMQDMVNNSDYNFFRDTALPTVGFQKLTDKHFHKEPAARQMFLDTMERTVKQLYNHPSILFWTIFNEGWGQFDSDNVYEQMLTLDDSRWIDSASGWFRQKKGDLESLHIYFGSWKAVKPREKPLALTEFGGYAYPVEGHIFNPEKAYGYRSCKSREDLNRDVENLYRQKVLPGIQRGLCLGVYTQVSDVEDEINGVLTYDRKVCKLDEEMMGKIAKDIQREMDKLVVS